MCAWAEPEIILVVGQNKKDNELRKTKFLHVKYMKKDINIIFYHVNSTRKYKYN